MTAAILTHFDLHRQKHFAEPDISGKLPALLNEAKKRVIKFCARGRRPWKIKSVNATLAASLLTLHQRGPHESRAVRDQRLHTDLNILLCLISRLNVQPGSQSFSWLQVRWTSIMDMCEMTGFSRSTVNASLARLKKAGILNTKRRKNETKDREWVAVRWITPVLFEMLGLGKRLRRQKEGTQDSKTQAPIGVTVQDEGLNATLTRARANHQARSQADPPDKPTTGANN